MDAVQLTRDDGGQLRLSTNSWETVLELGFLFGWRPAGTRPPHDAGCSDARSPGIAARRGQDYFSGQSQYVLPEDARALAEAVDSALIQVPGVNAAAPPPASVQSSPVPSRTSVIARGLSEHRRNAVHSFAVFASRLGGFTIDECR